MGVQFTCMRSIKWKKEHYPVKSFVVLQQSEAKDGIHFDNSVKERQDFAVHAKYLLNHYSGRAGQRGRFFHTKVALYLRAINMTANKQQKYKKKISSSIIAICVSIYNDKKIALQRIILTYSLDKAA